MEWTTDQHRVPGILHDQTVLRLQDRVRKEEKEGPPGRGADEIARSLLDFNPSAYGLPPFDDWLPNPRAGLDPVLPLAGDETSAFSHGSRAHLFACMKDHEIESSRRLSRGLNVLFNTLLHRRVR